jgi:hypothetical protein
MLSLGMEDQVRLETRHGKALLQRHIDDADMKVVFETTTRRRREWGPPEKKVGVWVHDTTLSTFLSDMTILKNVGVILSISLWDVETDMKISMEDAYFYDAESNVTNFNDYIKGRGNA